MSRFEFLEALERTTSPNNGPTSLEDRIAVNATIVAAELYQRAAAANREGRQRASIVLASLGIHKDQLNVLNGTLVGASHDAQREKGFQTGEAFVQGGGAVWQRLDIYWGDGKENDVPDEPFDTNKYGPVFWTDSGKFVE